MEVKEYQEIINKTAIYPKEIGLSYCALGLTGEAGEVANKVKKIYRDKGGVLSKQDAKEIAGEVADTLWYIAALAKELGTDLESLMEDNYKKLMKRRKTNTLGGYGDNRENIANYDIVGKNGKIIKPIPGSVAALQKTLDREGEIIVDSLNEFWDKAYKKEATKEKDIEQMWEDTNNREREKYLIATHVPRK